MGSGFLEPIASQRNSLNHFEKKPIPELDLDWLELQKQTNAQLYGFRINVIGIVSMILTTVLRESINFLFLFVIFEYQSIMLKEL